MNILFDSQAFEMQKFGGVSHSFVELACAIKREGHKVCIGIKESNNEYLKESGLVKNLHPIGYRQKQWFGHEQYFHGEDRIKRRIINAINYSLNPNHDYCVKLLKRQNFDVFHPTYFDSYFLPYLKQKPFVLTVHDMVPELYPQYFQKDDFQIVQKKLLCPLANHIVVPSSRTKEDMVNILDIATERITVIPHGYRKKHYCESECLLNLDYPYILYVGLRNEYKNFDLFVKEFSKVSKDYPEVHLFCTGSPFEETEKNLFAEYGISDKVHQKFASEAELQYLYRHAIAFVYPSDYEGFGMPILEAYANNCPVMLNNASCFPEVTGDAAIYFELGKGRDSDFYDKFKYLYLMSDAEKNQLLSKQEERLSLFSWEKAAESLIKVYESVI